MEYNVILILGSIIFPNFGSIVVHYVVHRNPLTKFWYKGLALPKWMLPKWANRPLWLVLYSCMGFASYLVWKTEGGIDGELDIEMVVYVIQLACNWIWPAIFFGLRSVLLVSDAKDKRSRIDW
jgi:tryptophan-rich sensory protein